MRTGMRPQHPGLSIMKRMRFEDAIRPEETA